MLLHFLAAPIWWPIRQILLALSLSLSRLRDTTRIPRGSTGIHRSNHLLLSYGVTPTTSTGQNSLKCSPPAVLVLVDKSAH
uniref:Putative secreted protein n=1 Tax=Anopheles marajoara TaxID=58244 RepID=A0A2M4CBK6_9DIPT